MGGSIAGTGAVGHCEVVARLRRVGAIIGGVEGNWMLLVGPSFPLIVDISFQSVCVPNLLEYSMDSRYE